MLLLKAIHVQLLPVYLPFNLEKDSVTATPKAQCLINCKLFLYCLHVHFYKISEVYMYLQMNGFN